MNLISPLTKLNKQSKQASNLAFYIDNDNLGAPIEQKYLLKVCMR